MNLSMKIFRKTPRSMACLGVMIAAVLPMGDTAARAQQGGGFADLVAIDREVANFVGHAIGQQGGAITPVDRRLRLATCRSPLALSWRLPRRETVVVECPDPGSWHLFVPVRASGAVPAAVAVARGEGVTIAVTGDGFTVSQPGEALEAGAVGEWIRVRSLREGTPKGEPMRARIARPGQVEVELP